MGGDVPELTDLILKHPDPALRTRCAPYETADAATAALDAMREIVGAKILGIAAPQIGIRRRAILINFPDGPLEMVNPVIAGCSSLARIDAESCLSLPGRRFVVERPDAVVIAYLDRGGRRVEAKAEGYHAKCIQHEIDHLDGVLIIDRALYEVPV